MALTKFCRFPLLFGILLISGVSCSSTVEDDGLEGVNSYHVALGIVLLICLIAALALCGGNTVAAARPVPPWVQTIQIDPKIDTGITGSSDGFSIINPNCVHRHRTGGWETDGAKWGAPLSSGKHVFEIYWLSNHRSQYAQVGVGSDAAKMFCKPRDSLIGMDNQSWGLDIARRKLIHRGEIKGTMPKTTVPDKFYMYVDADSGTLGFGSEFEYWGAPFNIPRDRFPVYAMLGSMCHNAQITMIYRGSETKIQAPVQVNTVVMPSGPVGGQMGVTVVNPNVIQTQHVQGYQPVPSGYSQTQQVQGYQPVPSGYEQPPPAYEASASPNAEIGRAHV